jgi:hypothetical protein
MFVLICLLETDKEERARAKHQQTLSSDLRLRKMGKIYIRTNKRGKRAKGRQSTQAKRAIERGKKEQERERRTDRKRRDRQTNKNTKR